MWRRCSRRSTSVRVSKPIARSRHCCILSSAKFKTPRLAPRGFVLVGFAVQCARIASSNSATMLVILIIGFTAGPAVSL